MGQYDPPRPVLYVRSQGWHACDSAGNEQQRQRRPPPSLLAALPAPQPLLQPGREGVLTPRTPTRPHRFKQYVLPIENACESNSWIGVANFGGKRSWMQSPLYGKWLDNCAHELGHNMFLDHASEDGIEYGDLSSIMGYGTSYVR
jgi:hypothetical protein